MVKARGRQGSPERTAFGLLTPLRKSAFAALVCLVANLAWLWPWLSNPQGWSHLHLYIFFFAAWAVVIALAMLASKSHAAKHPPSGD